MSANLEQYKVFYHVAKAGGITLAAEELSISQPAVSQSLKLLEATLGTALFVRTSKGVKLTSEGELLFSYVKRGYESILLGENKLSEMINLENGEIRIGASDMTLQFYLLPYLEKFHELYPGIKVTVTNGPTPETLKYLQEGRIDFGVVSTPIVCKQDLHIIKVREIGDVFVGGSKFSFLKDCTLPYTVLEELPTICLERNTSTRRYIDQYLAGNGVVLNPEFELATSEIIVQFAIRNLGVACVMRDFAKKYIESGELIELKFENEIPARNFCVITDYKNPASSAARRLLEMMETT